MGSGSSSTSNAWASAVLPRDTGRETRIMCWAGRALRWRGAAEEGLLARPERPSRWTLPITAFRVTFPSSAAIWLAESPPSQSFFSCSTRSSDQVNTVIVFFPSHRAGRMGAALAMPILKNPCGQNPLAFAGRKNRAERVRRTNGLLGSYPPHEMSYPTAQTLQYGVTLAQESPSARPHVPTSRHCNWSFPRHRNVTDCFILQCTKAARA